MVVSPLKLFVLMVMANHKNFPLAFTLWSTGRSILAPAVARSLLDIMRNKTISTFFSSCCVTEKGCVKCRCHACYPPNHPYSLLTINTNSQSKSLTIMNYAKTNRKWSLLWNAFPFVCMFQVHAYKTWLQVPFFVQNNFRLFNRFVWNYKKSYRLMGQKEII